MSKRKRRSVFSRHHLGHFAIALAAATGAILASLVLFVHLATDDTENLATRSDFFYAQLEKEKNFLYSFSRGLNDQVAAAYSTIKRDKRVKISVKFNRQEYPLTCEAAALEMALKYKGVIVTEDELLGSLNFDTKSPRDFVNNMWGDPDLGFVGIVDGSIFLGTGYGVHSKPIEQLAQKYRRAKALEEATLTDILQEVANGNPVLVWGLLSDREPYGWNTNTGKSIMAFPGEHVRVVVGHEGTIKNPRAVVMIDPILGKVVQSTEIFLRDWDTLDNQAVVIY